MAEEENVYGVTNSNEGKDVKQNGVNGTTTTDQTNSNGVTGTGGNTSTDTDKGKVTDDPSKGDQASPAVKQSQDWDAKVTDLDKQRTLNITESDGTTIKLVMHFPGIFAAEDILGNSSEITLNSNGEQVQRPTNGTYHKSLLGIFGTAEVNGKPASVDEDFFYDHEIQTYSYAMDQAGSFLSNPNGAFKSQPNS